jgi:tRNA(fMet)-specific endonuclease VapC
VIPDTTVLVDLQRELRRDEPGRACEFLGELDQDEVKIAFVTWMEMAEGFGRDEREACSRFLSNFRVLWPDIETAWRAGQVTRSLKDRGESIGDHDAWIAALALQHGCSVVTANDKHFRRVPGVAVQNY